MGYSSVILVGENGCNLLNNLKDTQGSWGMGIGLNGDCDCPLDRLIHVRVSRKTSSRPSTGDNAKAILNDTLLKRGYVVTVLCHGSSQCAL